MVKRITIICFILWGIVLSCARPVEEEILVPIDKLQGFRLKEPECEIMSFAADSIALVKVVDGIICSYFRRGTNPYALSLSSMEQMPLGSFVEYGSDWDQMMIATPSFGSGLVVLRDVIQNKITMLSPRDVFAGATNNPTIYKSNIIAQAEIPFGDRLLFLNPYAYAKRAPRVLISDSHWNYKWSKKYNYTAINLNHGSLQYNEKQQKIAYVSKNEPVIEIMTNTGRLLKTVRFPHLEGRIAEDKRGGIIEYLYYAPFPICFTSSDSDDNHIVASFETDAGESLLVQLDWEGNLISGFRVFNKIKEVSFSRDGTSVYCWETDGKMDFLNQYGL